MDIPAMPAQVAGPMQALPQCDAFRLPPAGAVTAHFGFEEK